MSHESISACMESDEFPNCLEQTELNVESDEAVEKMECSVCGRVYEYQYVFQGVWNVVEKEYVEYEEDFDWDEPEVTGENLVVPEEGGEVELSFILTSLYDEEGDSYDL